MDNRKAVNWLINISADIGKAEHSDLWHYEQALTEIKDMLESAQLEERTEKRTKTHVCDLISRQAAIDEIKTVYEWHDTVTMERLIEHLNNLPTVQPEPKEGHWIKHETPDGGEQYE